jgi:hypothetical protein
MDRLRVVQAWLPNIRSRLNAALISADPTFREIPDPARQRERRWVNRSRWTVPVNRAVHSRQLNRAHVADNHVLFDRLIQYRSVSSLHWKELKLLVGGCRFQLEVSSRELRGRFQKLQLS